MLGKNHQLPYTLNDKSTLHIFDKVHCDLWGPAPTVSPKIYNYYALFIDDHTRYTWYYPLYQKSNLCDAFIHFYNYVLNQFRVSIKCLECDGGCEFVS
jgi:hypothetical protein